MLYFLYGEDQERARAKTQELIDSLRSKKPDASFVKLEAESFSASRLEEAIGGQGLFENKYIIFIDSVFVSKETKEVFISALQEIAASENIFIALEGKVDKATLTKIEKKSAKVQEFSFAKTAVKKKPDFNIFSLTDAFGSRDKKSLWVLYQKALQHDSAPEEIHGILFWQLKSMLVSFESSSAKEAGLAPFVFMKAKSFLKNFSPDELKNLSKKLVALYSDARRGAVEFEIGLEKFILEI